MSEKENQNKIGVLEKDDCAIIFKANNECQVIIPTKDDDEITEPEILASALSFFLQDPKFVELIKTEFVRQINSQMINKNVKNDDE
jgi:hypothetical protein